MKVTSHETWVVRVPYDGRWTGRMPDDEGRTTQHVILRLHTDEGLDGISYVSRVGSGGTVAAYLQVLEAYLDQLEALDCNPLDTEAVAARLFRRGGTMFDARAFSQIDVALWDLKGKVAGRPVYSLLGGHSDRIACYASWRVEPRGDLESVARNAVAHVENGFKAMKSHVGALGEQRTVSFMRMMRDTVGDEVDLLLDVTQRWSYKEAVSTGRAVEHYRPYWIEDALPHEDYEGLRKVTEALPVKTCAGEAYRDVGPFRELVSRRAVDVVMIDLDLGYTRTLKVAHLAEAFGLPVVSHLATEIMAHAIAGVPNGLTIEYIPWAETLFKDVPRIEDGKYVLPAKPGLGLELDEAALAKYAV